MHCLYSSGANFSSIELTKSDKNRYQFSDKQKLESNLVRNINNSGFIQENNTICFIYCNNEATFLIDITNSSENQLSDTSIELFQHPFSRIVYENPYKRFTIQLSCN